MTYLFTEEELQNDIDLRSQHEMRPIDCEFRNGICSYTLSVKK